MYIFIVPQNTIRKDVIIPIVQMKKQRESQSISQFMFLYKRK